MSARLAMVRASRRAGFTLLEVMIAAAILGASLVVMFGFHAQAVRSNMNARRLTDCAFLAQSQMERLLSLAWTEADRPSDMAVGNASDTMWDDLTWPAVKSPVNVAFNTDASLGPPLYTVSWDVEDMDAEGTWTRIRVRCTYKDAAFNTVQGTTVSTYRFRDS